MKKCIALVAAVLALSTLFASHAAAQSPAGGRLRFVHALPGAPAVDVFVDNALAARGLEYGTATRFLAVKAGDHIIAVTPVGTGTQPSGTPLLNAKVTVSADRSAQLIVIQGTADKPEAGIFDQDLGPAAQGKTRLTAVHAIKDAPAVDILRADGSPLIQGLKYNDAYGAFDIPADTPSLAIVPAGGTVSGALITADKVSLVGGTHNTIIALGTVEGKVKPSYLLLTAPTDANNATDGLIRFVNASSTAKSVDVYVDGVLTVPGLEAGKATEHIAFPMTTQKLEIRTAGDAPANTPIGSGSLVVDSSKVKAQTIVLSDGDGGQMAVHSFADDVTKSDPAMARLNLINVLNVPVAVKINGKALSGSLEVGKQGASEELAPGVYPFEATASSGQVDVKGLLTVSGGTINDLVLTNGDGGAQLIVATTSLSEAPGSAPVSLSPVAVAAAPTATLAGGKATQPAKATQAPTAPPADQPTLVPTQPKPTVVPGIRGTVNTNPDVNMKIREYPRTDARTLALVPSQSVVTVRGVRGPSSKTVTAPPAGTKVPTPTLSATGRADIWLYVEWQTPDGGSITGWARSDFLDLVNNGKPISHTDVTTLLGFKEVPEDTPGAVNSSNATPVAPDSNRVVGTIKTNAGTNAQLRRTPGIDGESLSLVPAGSEVTVVSRTDVKLSGLVGEPKSPTWLFVQYDSQGSSIFGWMSADFLQLSRRGKPVDLKEIPVATEITRGYIQGGATPIQPPPKPGVIATVNNLTDGANLQLRRTPDANGESLALIPPGTQLDVIGRDGTGTWIQVTYNGQDGWVNGQFVKITKNGKKFSVGDIKITTNQKDTFGTLTPTPSPSPTGAGG